MTPIHLWLVDDSPTVAATFAAWAEELGFQLTAMASGQALCQLLQEGDLPLDIIIIDDDLPGVPTCQTVRQIRDAFCRTEIPIFALSDEFNANFRDVFRMAGGDGWIDNPPEKEQLRSLLDRVREKKVVVSKESRSINFRVKMGRLGLHWDGERLLCCGSLDENAGFERLERILPHEHESIVIDFAEVPTVNLAGVQAWNAFVTEDFGAARKFRFRRVPLALLEFYNLMPEQFGDKVEVESLNIPVASHLDLAVSPIAAPSSPSNSDGGLMSGIHKLIAVSGGYRECLYFSNLDPILEVTPPITGKTLTREYLYFLHTVLRFSLSEFFITQQTVLDQASRLAARFSCFRQALESVGAEFTVPPADRRMMREVVIESYEPIFAGVLVSETVLKCLKLKSTTEVNLLTHRGKLLQVVQGLTAEVYDEPIRRLRESSLLSQELTFDSLPTQENLEQLIMEGYTAVSQIMTDLGEIINSLGVHVLKVLRSFCQVEMQVTEQVAEGLLDAEVSAEAHEEFRGRSLLWWDTDCTFRDSVEESEEMVHDYQLELNRIIETLDSHDQLNQVIEHRVLELAMLAKGCTREELVEQIANRAVTLVEKRVSTFYFPELEGRFDDSVSSEGILLF